MYVLCTPICCAPTECSLWRGTSYRAKGQWTSSPVSWLCVRRGRGSPVLRRSSLWTMRLTCMDQLEPQVHSPAPGALDSTYVWSCGVRYLAVCCALDMLATKVCMYMYHILLVALPRLLTKDPLVQEVNLGANLIGESAALEILEGLKQRKEGRHWSHMYILRWIRRKYLNHKLIMCI